MKKINSLVLFFIGSMAASVAFAAPISTATLSGFIQNGVITNDAGSGANISSIVYDLGTAADGIATWDSNGGAFNGGPGATLSNFLSNPNFFQTVTYSGLSIASGSSFSFGNLDIDLITSLSPLSVTGSVLDNIGTSLANASLSIFWDNGTSGSVALVQQAWSATQNLTINAAAVPAPATLALFGLGLVGLGFTSRKKKA